MKIKVLMLAVLFLAIGFTAEAQTVTPKVKTRQLSQAKRVKQGVKSGELTKRETVQLAKQQKHIQRSKKRAKADGVVTKKERARLHRKQTRASKNIARAKHNNKSRN